MTIQKPVSWPFVGREDELRRFKDHLKLDKDPNELSDKSVLCFHGPAGIGKSALLRHLLTACEEHSTRSRASWARQVQTNEAVRAAEHGPTIATTFVNFGSEGRGVENHQDPVSALLYMRGQLKNTARSLAFQTFAFAVRVHITASGRSLDDAIKKYLTADELTFLGEIFALLEGDEVPGTVKAGVKILDKLGGEKIREKLRKRGIPDDVMDSIRASEPVYELPRLLPKFFAGDLNRAMARDSQGRFADERAPRRVVLFFDNHDAFWGSGDARVGHSYYHQQDEWLRALLVNLRFERGIIVVVAGERRPRWNDAPVDTRVKNVSSFNLPLLGKKESDAALRLADVQDQGLRGRIYDAVRESADQKTKQGVRPLFLRIVAEATMRGDLDAKSVRDWRRDGLAEGVLHVLLGRFDDETVEAVSALAACRAFDRDVYFQVGEWLQFERSRSRYRRLLELSLVEPSEGDRYGVIGVLEELLQERLNATKSEAHLRLERWFNEQWQRERRPDYKEAALYHLAKIDPDAAARAYAEALGGAGHPVGGRDDGKA